MLRPRTSAVTSRLRDTASWVIAAGLAASRTWATSPSRTRSPDGVSMSNDWRLRTLARVGGPPHSTTSKMACPSYSLPTVSPETIVLASRRMSPGRRPTRWADGRSTWISIVGSVTSAWTTGAMTPGTVWTSCRTSSAVLRRVARSSP